MGDSTGDGATEPEPTVIRDSDEAHAEGSVTVATAGLVGEGTAIAHPGGVLITVSLWFIWLEVAVERAREARRIRAEMLRLQGEGEPVIDLLNLEFEASVVAIAACAHALDALYGSQVIPASARNQGQNRPGKIREALKQTFNTGPVNTRWVGEFTKLFDLRDAAVHAGETPSAPELHPVAGYTARENTIYSVEATENAVNFTLSVFRRCVDHPKQGAMKWAANIEPLIRQLEQRWSAPNV
jgi:hypothetical protein